MRRFHMILQDAAGAELRRVDFNAEGPDHAFQIARNEGEGVRIELWQGSMLLARMTKSGANMWKLLPTADVLVGSGELCAPPVTHA